MANQDIPPLVGSKPKVRQPGLADLEVHELLSLREKIDALLPQKGLKDLNMEHELVIQLQIVKQMQKDVIDDDSVPANQRAQVAGQVANVMSTLSKLQVEVYDAERMKQIEACTIEAINTLNPDAQKVFFDLYEVKLGKAHA